MKYIFKLKKKEENHHWRCQISKSLSWGIFCYICSAECDLQQLPEPAVSRQHGAARVHTLLTSVSTGLINTGC